MNNIKLIIVHQQFFKSWDKDWAYVGRNFSMMQNWEKKIGSGKRILITNLFRHFFDNDKIDFLKWCDDQKNYNKDSLNWWMSHLAGRNNMSSFLYESICQIKALQLALTNQEECEKEILVVCENTFLCSAVIYNLKCEGYEIITSRSFYVGKLYNWFKFCFSIPIGLILTLYKLSRSHIAAIQSKKYIIPKYKNGNEIYLIHQCLDIKSFQNEAKLTDRYFTNLPTWIEENGKNVIRLPWLFNVKLPYNKIYRRLRKDDCLVIEDYLNFFDYYFALINFIKSIFSTTLKISYKNFNLKPLLINEILLQATASNNIRFWLYGPALVKWSKDLVNITIIDTFEMMPPEHAQISFLRRLNSRVTFLGYYHSLVSKDFLAYWNYNMDMGKSILPDYIITNGKLGKKLLSQQGYTIEKIIEGPALRQNFNENSSLKKINELILLCPFDLDSALEAILKLKQAMKNLLHLNLNIQIKAHPMMVKTEILKKLPNNNLPYNWQWNDMEISEAIQDKFCCVVLASASIYDAILNNCIVINMQRELSAMGNFADILQDKYPLLKEVPDIDLSKRIDDIFSKNTNFYKLEFLKIKLELLQGLNPVNDTNLKVFINSY